MSKNNVTMDFNPNDFFYVNADKTDITDEKCNNSINGYRLISDTSCNYYIQASKDISKMPDMTDDSFKEWKTIMQKCHKKELCANKDGYEKMNEIQNNNQYNQQYHNYLEIYNNEYLKSFNLVAGIVLLIATIIYIK